MNRLNGIKNLIPWIPAVLSNQVGAQESAGTHHVSFLRPISFDKFERLQGSDNRVAIAIEMDRNEVSYGVRDGHAASLCQLHGDLKTLS